MKKEIFGFFLLVLLININVADAKLADSPWPMYQGNLKHTGVSSYDTSHVDGTLKWKFQTGGPIEPSPVIAEDGTIYIGSHDGNFYAINPDGTEKWVFHAAEPEYVEGWDVYKAILSTAAIGSDGTIYFVSFADKLFALNPDGTIKWTFPMAAGFGAWSSAAIAQDGTIYIGSARDGSGKVEIGGRLYAISPDGTEKWHFQTESDINSNPAVGDDGTIYFGSGTGIVKNETYLHAINPDGTEKWRFTAKTWIESAPTVADDGTVYTNTYEGMFYAVNKDGSLKWEFRPGVGMSCSPAIGEDGTVYFGAWDNFFYAFHPNGTMKWKYETPPAFEGIGSAPAIAAEGTIYVGSNNQYFYAFNPNGTLKWSFKADASVGSSPAIGSDGTVYVGSWDGYLYAFTGSSNGTESTQPTQQEMTPAEGTPIQEDEQYDKTVCGNGICEPGEDDCHDDCAEPYTAPDEGLNLTDLNNQSNSQESQSSEENDPWSNFIKWILSLFGWI